MRGVSWLAEYLLASQEELRFKELVTLFFCLCLLWNLQEMKRISGEDRALNLF
jgi:hypothetical protein